MRNIFFYLLVFVGLFICNNIFAQNPKIVDEKIEIGQNGRVIKKRITQSFDDIVKSSNTKNNKYYTQFDTTYTLEHITPTGGIGSINICTIVEDSLGRLYFAGYDGGGISIMESNNWDYIRQEDGLASEKIRCIDFNSKGDLWISNYTAVIKMNAEGMTTYDYQNYFNYCQVDFLYIDSKDNVWVNTGNGLYLFENNNWKKISDFNNPNALDIGYVNVIMEDSKGFLWFGGRNGISRFDGVNWVTYSNDLAGNNVSSLCEDSNGNIWVSFSDISYGEYTCTGVSVFDGAEWSKLSTADGLYSNHVSCIYKDSEGKLWFSHIYSSKVSILLSDGSWDYIDVYEGLETSWIKDIYEDSNNNMWFATSHGAFSFKNGTIKHYSTGESLTIGIQSVSDIYQDSKGRIWFSGWGGVSVLDGEDWTNYTPNNGFPDVITCQVTEDISGNIWLTTYFNNKKLIKFSDTGWEEVLISGLPADRLIPIESDNSGNLWIGFGYSGYGVAKYDGSSIDIYNMINVGLSDDHIEVIQKDNEGNLWFAHDFMADGLTKFDGSEWTTYDITDGLAANRVNDIEIASSGGVWFATSDGVSRYNGSNWYSFTRENSDINGDWSEANINAVEEDLTGRVWCSGNEMSVINKEQITFFEDDNFIFNYIYDILCDNEGNLWFATNGNGVYKLSYCGSNTGTDVITTCDSYVWIDGNTYTSNNNSATYTLTNVNGCDSVVTLDLTINTVDVTVAENEYTLTANVSGACYQWIDCNDNNNHITGETSQSFTATENGSFAVIVDNGLCIDTSTCYTINSVGINEIENLPIDIYPNPTRGIIEIDFTDEKIHKISIIDIFGKIIIEKSNVMQREKIDLSDSDNGLYIILIETDKEIYSSKIIKQ